MAAQRIIDLDAAVPEGIAVKINGEKYLLPGDIPVPDYLEIARLSEKLSTGDEASAEALEGLYEQVLDLFRIEQPDLEDLPIGPERLGTLIMGLYSAAAEEDAPTSARPTKSRNGTASTRKKRPKRSASSRS
jgi:hypothetical protein